MDYLVKEAAEVWLYPNNFKRFSIPHKPFVVSAHEHDKSSKSNKKRF
jgi:hypothetical protein